MESEQVKTQLADVQGKYDIASKDYEETSEKYEGIRQEYEAIQSRIETLEKEIEEARNNLTDTSVLRGKLEGEINVLKEQIHSATDNAAHLQTRKVNLNSQIAQKDTEKQEILAKKRKSMNR